MRRALAQSRTAAAIGGVGFVLALIALLAPIAALVVHAVSSAGLSSPTEIASAFASPRQMVLLTKSVLLSACVAFGAVAIGLLASLGLLENARPVVRTCRILLPILIAIPPFVHALGWTTLVQALLAALQPAGPSVLTTGWPGWFASWWVELMSYLPIGAGLAAIGLAAPGAEVIEAGLLSRPPRDVLIRIILPMTAPYLSVGFTLIFLLSLADYTVPSLFSANVYAMEIFAQFSADSSAANAILTSLPLLVVCVPVLWLTRRIWRRSSAHPAGRLSLRLGTIAWPWWLGTGISIATLLLLLQVAVPLLSLSLLTGGWDTVVRAAWEAKSEMMASLRQSLLASFISLPLGAAVAAAMSRRGGVALLGWIAIGLPFMVPAPLIGVGLNVLLNGGWIPQAAADASATAWAGIVRFLPIPALILFAQQRLSDRGAWEAACIYQSNALQSWWRIRLPLAAPALLAAFATCFALTMSELPATLVVAPPGSATLTMRIYNLLHYGASVDVAALCLLLLAVTGVAGTAGAAMVIRSRVWRSVPDATGDASRA